MNTATTRPAVTALVLSPDGDIHGRLGLIEGYVGPSTGLVMPPRVLFTPHDRGKNLGTAGATDMQRTIVRAALRLLETAYEPFTTQDWEPELALA